MNEEYKKNEYNIENTFKMGKVLVIRNDFDLAVDKFTEVCFSIESFLFSQDKYPFNIKFLIDSLYFLGDIYEKKKETDKSLCFYKLRRKFLEFLNNHPEIIVSNQKHIILPQAKPRIEENVHKNNAYEDRIETLRNDFSYLFNEIHKITEMKSNIMTDKDIANLSENIKKQYQSTKQDERTKAGIFLQNLSKMKKEEDMKTFSGRARNYFGERSNSLFIILIIIIIVIAFILILTTCIKLYSVSKFKEKQQRMSYLNDLNAQIKMNL